METVDKRCGNCGWWVEERKICYWTSCNEVPFWIDGVIFQVADKLDEDIRYCEETDGEGCPCHKPKEEGK